MSTPEQHPVLRGGCYCGSVSFSVNSAPVLSAYCHCTICQRLLSCPFVHSIHLPASAFSWTHPEPHESRLHSYSPAEKPHKTRWRCKNCGSSISSYNSKTDRWSVWACVLERDEEGHIKNWDIVKPTYHMFYGTKVIEVDDGLGKWEGYENQSKRIA